MSNVAGGGILKRSLERNNATGTQVPAKLKNLVAIQKRPEHETNPEVTKVDQPRQPGFQQQEQLMKTIVQ